MTQKLNTKRNLPYIYYLVAPDNTGKLAWYYIHVAEQKIDSFIQNISNLKDLAHWGKVIVSGYGERSPHHIRQEMNDEYGFTHDD